MTVGINPSKQKLTRVLSVIALITSFLSLTSQAYAASIKTQSPCVDVAWCVAFTWAEEIPTIRSISFDAPGSGVMHATFHGSMTCAIPANNFLILDGQIVTNASQTANKDGPGGLQFKANHAEPGVAADQNVTFNLAASRAITVNRAGVRRFHFKLNKLQMDGGFCIVHNATFTVLFVP